MTQYGVEEPEKLCRGLRTKSKTTRQQKLLQKAAICCERTTWTSSGDTEIKRAEPVKTDFVTSCKACKTYTVATVVDSQRAIADAHHGAAPMNNTSGGFGVRRRPGEIKTKEGKAEHRDYI